MKNIAIKVKNISKIYKLYNKPMDRLKESLHPLKKRYHKEFYALNDINFEIKKGETVGIIGKNGAGKSTMLKIITGVLTPTSGHVQVNGRIASLLELGAGFNPEYTGVENIYFQGTLMGFTHQEMETKVADILAFADIGDFVHQRVKMYSSGMFTRLAFAVAINVSPDILIVDEVLSVGDIYFVQKCMSRINEIKAKGTTVLLVSHDATTIRMLCDSALWLENGKILDSGNTSKVVDNYLAFMSNDKNIDDLVYVEPNSSDEKNIENSRADTVESKSRFGTLECEILKYEILDSDYKKAYSVYNDSDFVLRISVINHTYGESKPLIIGYSLRNRLGIDIASSNNKIEGIPIFSPKQSEIKIVDLRISLPQIYPDKYTINLSINSIDREGETVHSIIGATSIDILSKKTIYVLLSLKTIFSDYKTYGSKNS